MNIKIIEGFPQKKESSMSLTNPWMMNHHLFASFLDKTTNKGFTLFIEDAEDAKELAKELLDAYNKLMHWVEKREEEE